MRTAWNLVGEGTTLDDCGRPFLLHEFTDGVRVWGPKQCTRRQCPRCADRRYLHDASDDMIRNLMSWIAQIIATRGLYDNQGRSLKIYHYIHSRFHEADDPDLKAARRAVVEDVQGHGMICGYSITHPYRGSHGRKDTPKECREKMNREQLSIHHHGIALGHWSKPSSKGQNHYYSARMVMDIRDWIDPDNPIWCRSIMLKELQYDIGHAGWFGERGQCITSWGYRPKEKSSIPPHPQMAYKHPDMMHEGEHIWERAGKVDGDTVKAFDKILDKILQNNYQLRSSGEWALDDVPKTMGLHTLVYVGDLETEEWHNNWYDWRWAVSQGIKSIMQNKGPP